MKTALDSDIPLPRCEHKQQHCTRNKWHRPVELHDFVWSGKKSKLLQWKI